MVFEAVVVELLNKFLKQYVENLDTSQLKIGIWGGDVILKDLRLKTTLFDDLDLPLRVKWGKLGHLSMKIPWKNLYGSQVVFVVEELLMIVIPNTEIKYDPVKEEKWAQDKKQAKLKVIEEAKKRELETTSIKTNDGFIEKLLAQITKNLQIEIKNIHIRYEDKTTNPSFPFSVGLTMSNLSAQTTVNNTSINFSKFMVDNDSFICKAIDLEGLSIYWNSASALYSDLPDEELINALTKSIPTSNIKPKGFKYMFGPLSSSAFLRLNSKPELDGSDFTIPKIFVSLHLREIELGVSHNQFSDLLMFLENYDRLAAASKYKKYRPVGIPVTGYSKQWWHFAYNSVAESIRRRKKEWSWEHIQLHRNMCRKYSELFKQKLNSKKLPAIALVEINELERKLNVFNLILIREQVYVEVERSNLKKIESKSSGGWFSGWFGTSNASKLEELEGDELVKKIESVMTVQEKEKLYKAIGYEESAPPTNYPPNFVESQYWCHLEEIKLTVYDDRLPAVGPVMTSSIKIVKIEFEERPSDYGMKLVMMVGNFQVLGKNEQDIFPELITSNCVESQSLFEILYETKPIAASCDQRIIVTARPLKIIYHANTINVLHEMFSGGTEEDVSKIVAATSASLPTFQKITAAGLQYAIEKRTVLEMKLNIMSSYLIIPYGGFYQPNREMIVLALGHLSVETEENVDKDVNVKELYLKGTTEQDIFSTVLLASYTKFKLHLTGVQILFQLSGEDWVAASKVRGTSPLRFLESINLEVILKKSLVTDDARIPKVILEGKLPSLMFNFSEERFIAFAALFFSIPTKTPGLKKEKSASAWSLQSIGTQLENRFAHFQKDSLSHKPTEYVQGIDLVSHFEMNDLIVKVSKTTNSAGFDSKLAKIDSKKELKLTHVEEQFLTLRVVKMEFEMTYKTFETVNLLKLGGIEINQYHDGKMLSFVSTKKLEQDYYLFVVEHINLDTKVPDFYTTRGGIINRLTLNVTPLNVVLNQEALLAQIAFATNLQVRLELVKQASRLERMGDAGKIKDIGLEESHGDKKVLSRGKRFRKKRLKKEVIDFFLDASLDEIDVVMGYVGHGLVEFSIKGGSVEISTRKSYTNVDFKIRQIALLDLNPNTFYKEIVISLDQQTLLSRVTVFNSEYFGSERSADVAIEAEFGQLRCAFLKVFFLRVLEFLNAFQLQIKSLKQGATVAAQRAKENVLKAYQNAAQVCLDIKMIAPLLIMPKTSTSLETLVVDLGVLTIKNGITELDYSAGGELVGRPIIDSMRLQLQKLKITRCILTEKTMQQEDESVLLVPVSFELTIKRNLSKNWFRVIPELEILARLASIHVVLTHEDLCFVASVVRDNLNEGGGPNKEEESPLPQQKVNKIPKHKKELQQQDVQVHLPETLSSKQTSTFYTTVKFMFFMDSFVVDALVKKVDDENEKVGLAKFVLETISLKGKTFSDNSVHTSIMLVSCILDDMRPSKKDKIRRLMERTIDSENMDIESEANPLNSMIELTFQQKDSDTFVDVRVYKFTLILSMDFLHKLGLFFTLNECVSTSGVENLENVKTVKALEKSIKIVAKEEEGEEEEKERFPTFTFNVRLEKPDIIIVESMDSIDTDALIFNTEMVVKYRFAGARQVVSGTFSDMELYSCCFNPEKRLNSLSQVIKPFTISVAGSTPPGQGLHVDVRLTDIYITINPSTVELLSNCYQTLFSSSLSHLQNLNVKELDNLWDVEKFDPDSYWFLKPEPAVEALASIETSPVDSETEKTTKEEICLLSIPSIEVLVEDVSINQTKPLLLLEMGFEFNCFNWSQKLTAESKLSLQMQYFNNTLSAWEPLIEPVEGVTNKKKHSYLPWELKCSIVVRDEGDLDWNIVQPPKISVSLSCSEILQVTVTKKGLDVLKKLVKTYTSAVTKGVVNRSFELPPYIVKNETGVTVELLLKDCDLQVCKAINEYYKIVQLESNSQVELQDRTILITGESLLRNSSLTKKHTRLCIRFPFSKKDVIEFQLNINSKRYYSINVGDAERGETWGLVADISIKENTTTVLLQSIVKIVNDMYQPINVHLLSENEKEVEYVGTVEGRSVFNLPFHAVYREQKNLFFSVNGYSLSIQSFPWNFIGKDDNYSELLQCNSKDPENKDPFFFQALGIAEQIHFSNTNRRTSSSICYRIHLHPTVKIINSLPTDLVVCFQGCAKERNLKPGDTLHITNAEPGASTITLRISDYLEREWSCKETIMLNPPEFFIWKFVSYNGVAPEVLNLGVHCSFKNRTAVFVIYCPYFMVNKTEHLLSYKFEGNPTVFYHPGDMNQPIMFSTNVKKFFSKKSALLQVEQSDWSEKFPVDVAGCGGTVKCEDVNITYKISVRITLTYNNLTRIIVFTPFYVFVNNCDYSIEYQEYDFPDQPWEEVPPDSCKPFWPKSNAKLKTVHIRPKDSYVSTPPFGYDSTDSCLLRLSHKYGGIFVNIQATQSGNYITLNPYEPGQAPVLILNHSAKDIKLSELSTEFNVTLKPLQQMLHAWVCPTGRRKLVLTNFKQKKETIHLEQDTEGRISTSKGESIRYVTFLEGAQRVLLFTDDSGLTCTISSTLKGAYSGIEVVCKIQGIGVSLVNNTTQLEILYLGFVSSGIAWETRKPGKRKFKALNAEDTYKIEAAYERYKSDLEVRHFVDPVVEIADKLKVNFEKMEMIQPYKKEIRRTFEPGLWIAYRLVDNQVMIHMKINRIQVDNQLHDCIFPVVLAPTPPPKTVATASQFPKPFVELSLLKVQKDKRALTQYKYFKILVQEFQVKIDIGFLQQIWVYLAAEESTNEELKLNFKKDLDFTRQLLMSHVEIVSSTEQKNFYELLHLSPLKVHFSFSLAGNIESGSLPPSFSVMLQSLGVTLTDVHDVIFRLSYFERKSAFLTQTQLINEVISHYYGQAVRQAYVLLLGLDVIGNPYGLIVGIKEGVEAFFYEPVQGIIQGPSDFAAGVAIGCRSLFGRTVGSTAGTLGKLTETLGKGLAVLSLDKEYQIQRMEAQNRSENIQASMARGGRGLVMGVFEGVTGVVKKPIEGAKEEGVGGFFKGVGKGMMGLVTRPVTGVVDFASSSFNAVKRVAEQSVDNKRLRPPRFFRSDSLVEPYNLHDAKGNAIFHAICKRKFCVMDKYEYYAELKGKEVVVLTNKRIILAELNELFGTWQEHVAILWNSMPDRPHSHSKGVAITMPPRMGMPKKDKPDIKVLLIEDKEVKEEMYNRMVELYKYEVESDS